MEYNVDPKVFTAGVVLVALWIGEACIPFYTDFQRGIKCRLIHGARNFGFGFFNSMLLVVLYSAVLAAVTT